MKCEPNWYLMRNTNKMLYYVSNIQKAKKLYYAFNGQHSM